ncbi:hypothetical protein NXH64_10805 [Butyrivibrio fibrisolvens]|uniref:hypothetical protein n=1 Tax=Pseudobutyrivibrio ruminis TaxID=46206 RepID=UPI0004804EF3|nr:hypothetical protein [Pseudobutyrivibrio ruminis]MDC7279988.1 hypothetical protein [Butyrivibrio fibrisolvens]
MLNSTIFYSNMCIHLTVTILIAVIFTRNIKKMRKIMKVVTEDDSEEMGLLQKEYIPDGISTLTALDIYQLLEIWASILLFIQIMSMVSSYQYKSFVSDLYRIIPMDTYERAVDFSGIYNSTHGFKYIGMFSALIIGIFVSAVFLKDRFLKIISVIITAVFILAFCIFQMITFDMEVKIISIVWTSVIYHGMETIGLLLFSFYLAKHYKGL